MDFRRLDLVAQAGGRKRVVTDESDLADAGLLTLVNLEHEVDAIVRQLDDLGGDLDIESAVPSINFDDALHVGLHSRSRERAARLGLDLERDLFILELLVALECDTVDDRVLDHRHNQPAAGRRDTHVLKQAGSVQRLQRLVGTGSVQPPARAGAEIGADGIGLNTAVALDHDGARALCPGAVSRGDGQGRSTESTSAEDQANQA